MMAAVQIVVALTLISVGITYGGIACRDPSGNDVDWFYVYKLPRITTSSNPLIQEGIGHYYLDVNSPSFKLSDVKLNDTAQAIAQTLKPIYSQSDKLAYLMYNDEWPNDKRVDNRGHTKGVVAFDSDTGYWLIHSVPKFPDNSSYYYPPNGEDYGQSMLCVTFKTSSMETIAQAMAYTYPSVYASSLPGQLLQLAPSFEAVLEGRHITTPPWTSKATLVSAFNKQQFLLYAKFTDFNQDLYVDFVAPDLRTGLRTETWRNGAHQLPSNCSTDYHVLNVRNITLPDVGFPSTKDHSKLAITDTTVGAVCVGDINRMQGQFIRGGGTLCAKIPAVYQQYNSIVRGVEECAGSLQ